MTRSLSESRRELFAVDVLGLSLSVRKLKLDHSCQVLAINQSYSELALEILNLPNRFHRLRAGLVAVVK